jgi:Putative beta-barrel porin-2, OmpL-like. bbp2
VFHVGGYVATELEYHQEPDGDFVTKIELNQFKLFFASHRNSASSKNKVSVFAEFNPIPEEVIHQVDSATVTKGIFSNVLREPNTTEGEELIAFERLFVNISNVGGSGINVTLGQFRNPFGLWSDYTSHRNFSSTKTNLLVNGFALKKIELGIKADYKFNENLELEAAVVNGRFGRTGNLLREDIDNEKDFVTHLTYTHNRLAVGASAYFSNLSFNKRSAYGVDLTYRFDKLLISGEWAMQQNNDVTYTAVNIAPFVNQLSSHSGYLQFDWALTNKLHVYGLYDYWQLKADNKIVNKDAFKTFNGLKYYINSKTRWTIFEYGHMFYDGFEKGYNHIATHLEINF